MGVFDLPSFSTSGGRNPKAGWADSFDHHPGESHLSHLTPLNKSEQSQAEEVVDRYPSYPPEDLSPSFGPAGGGAPVRLTAWRRRKTAILFSGAALLLQVGILLSGIYLAVHPIHRPSSPFITPSLSVKFYNILIALASTVVSLITASAVALGAESVVTRRFVGGGIHLADYDFWQSVAGGGMAKGFGRRMLLAGIMLLILTNSNSAYTALYNAAPDSLTSTQITLKYPTVLSNTANIANDRELSVILFNVQDFEAYIFSLWDQRYNILGARYTAAGLRSTLSVVDGVLSNVASGTLPALGQVATLTDRIFAPSGPGEALSDGVRKVIGSSSNNTYVVSSPVLRSSFTCSTPDLRFSTPVQTSPASVLVNVTSTHCGDSTFEIDFPTSIYSGIFMCAVNSTVYLDFFGYVSPQLGSTVTSEPLLSFAACQGTVQFGDGDKISYSDSQTAQNSSYQIPQGMELRNIGDFATPSVRLLGLWWLGRLDVVNGVGHSPALDHLLANILVDRLNTNTTFDALPNQNVSDADFYEIFEIVSEGLTAMTGVKVVNTLTTQLNYYPEAVTASVGIVAYNSTVFSQAIFIGPDGFNKLWLALIAGIVVILFVAFISVIQFTPYPLNPLDPVSVLLVATNSPPSHSVDGGCMGDTKAIRVPRELMSLRAINERHLAFVWGREAEKYPAPQDGKLYGSTEEHLKND